MSKINVGIQEISYLYWVLFVFYIGFGFFGMSWFGDYYFDALQKHEILIFKLSILVLLLGGLDGVGAIFRNRLMRLCVFIINVTFFIVMVGLFQNFRVFGGVFFAAAGFGGEV